jgi:hypothetical protein
MKNGETDRIERTAGADLWRNSLSRIPTVFGKLVYLSSLRSPVTGKYEHNGLELMFGEAEAIRALRRNHVNAFNEWLTFDMMRQKADLDLYLSSMPDQKASILENWVSVRTYRTFIPSSAKGVEKRLYIADFETLLALLTNEHGVSAPDRGA